MRKHPPPPGARQRRVQTIAVSSLLASGCAHATWSPPPPSGPTYVYEDQGFVEKSVNVAAGGSRHFSYGGAFAFRGASGVHGDSVKDPFEQSVPINGIEFNEHLQNQGLQVEPVSTMPQTGGPTRKATDAPSGTRKP